MNKSLPGDIILFKFDKRYWYARPWAAIISWVINSRYTHAAMVVDPAYGGVIVEAYYPKVRMMLLDNCLEENMYTWEVWRPKGCSPSIRKAASVISQNYVSKPYDVSGLFALAWEFVRSGILGKEIRRESALKNHNNKWFCSELVDQCYKNSGFVLDGRFTIGAMAPSDFANEERFELIETSQDSQ